MLGAGAYIASNIKIINVSAVADTDKAVLWCGQNAGFVAYQPELAKGTSQSWRPFNGQMLRANKQEFMDEITLEMADNPFGGIGIGIASNYFDGLASGLDSAIRQECSGEKNAYVNFVDNVESAFDQDQVGEMQEPSHTQPETDTQSTSSDYPQYEDELEKEDPDYFSCVVLSEPTYLEEQIIFTATNNCATKIDSISWDINILTTDLNLIDTSTADFSDLMVGETKQAEVYLSVPVGEFNWEAIPDAAYVF